MVIGDDTSHGAGSGRLYGPFDGLVVQRTSTSAGGGCPIVETTPRPAQITGDSDIVTNVKANLTTHAMSTTIIAIEALRCVDTDKIPVQLIGWTTVARGDTPVRQHLATTNTGLTKGVSIVEAENSEM
jgi:hypothetical protein